MTSDSVPRDEEVSPPEILTNLDEDDISPTGEYEDPACNDTSPAVLPTIPAESSSDAIDIVDPDVIEIDPDDRDSDEPLDMTIDPAEELVP